MRFWKGFTVTCSDCGHRNRPHPSPSVGIEMALRGQLKPCRGCGKELRPKLSDRPLIKRVRDELQSQGVQTVC